jgi:hypothetical protein
MNLKTISKYGVLAGAFIALAMQISLQFYKDGTSYQYAELLGYLTILLGFVLVYIGIKKIRDQRYDGEINFKQAFMVGLKIALVASILYAVLWVVYITIEGNDFMDLYFQRAIEEINAGSESAEEKLRSLEKLARQKKVMMTTWAQAGMAFLEPFPVGVGVSAISAAILRKK